MLGSSPETPRPRILIVDDEESIIFALRRFFASSGFDVETTSELHEAHACLSAGAFDAVIADLRLSGPDGLEGLEILSWARTCQPGVRTVLLTAFSSPQIERQVERLGIDLLLHKPQPLTALVAAVTSLLAPTRSS